MISALQIKPSQLRDLLALAIPAKLPILIVGAPGIGKTDIVSQATAQAGAALIIMHPVVSDPTDFKGLPWVVNGVATFLPIGDLNALILATTLTVCFIDDFGQAPPAVQAALMQLILSRRINGHAVSDHVVFIAATNRRQDRAGVSGILEPVKSRFTIVELVPDLRELTQYAASKGFRPEVIAYWQLRPDNVNNFQPTADITNSPNSRNWEEVSKLMNLNLPASLQLPAFGGRVGEAVGAEFTAFLRTWASMVSPDLILTSPNAAPIPTESSALYAVCLAIAQKVTTGTMANFCRYLERLYNDGKQEFAAVAMQCSISRDNALCATSGYINAMAGPLGKLMLGTAS